MKNEAVLAAILQAVQDKHNEQLSGNEPSFRDNSIEDFTARVRHLFGITDLKLLYHTIENCINH
jgi:hypothetical protein